MEVRTMLDRSSVILSLMRENLCPALRIQMKKGMFIHIKKYIIVCRNLMFQNAYYQRVRYSSYLTTICVKFNSAI
uniref:Uncharacterized protein n=1 Tax=Pararge aegeria TaxID=116150 RepID=S4PVB8_9NEOP